MTGTEQMVPEMGADRTTPDVLTAARRLRIVVVTPFVRKADGQGRVNYELIRRALELGHELTIVAGDVAPEIARHPAVSVVSIGAFRLPSQILRSQVASIQMRWWLARHRGRFDVVNVNGAVTLARSDVNSVHFVHSAWIASAAAPWRRDRSVYGLYRRLLSTLHSIQERIAFGRTKFVVAVSEQVRSELLAIGVEDERIRVVHNGVDTSEFHPGPGDRKAHGLPESAVIAMFAGDMSTPRKNLDTVLKALVEVPHVHLAVIGSLEKNPYPAMAQRLGVAERVSFLGFRRDFPAIMRCADMFVFPSRYETCSLVMLEAMATGIPVITARSAGGAELVRKASGIVLDDPEDHAGLADAIRTLASDARLASALSSQARDVALAHSFRRTADGYMAVFGEVVQTCAAE